MDPNECLEQIRELANWDSDDDGGSVVDALSELQERVIALDRWLSNGELLPIEWER